MTHNFVWCPHAFLCECTWRITKLFSVSTGAPQKCQFGVHNYCCWLGFRQLAGGLCVWTCSYLTCHFRPVPIACLWAISFEPTGYQQSALGFKRRRQSSIFEQATGSQASHLSLRPPEQNHEMPRRGKSGWNLRRERRWLAKPYTGDPNGQHPGRWLNRVRGGSGCPTPLLGRCPIKIIKKTNTLFSGHFIIEAWHMFSFMYCTPWGCGAICQRWWNYSTKIIQTKQCPNK